MRILLIIFIFLTTQTQTIPVRSLIEDETVLPINLDENSVIPLSSGDPIQLKSTSDELSTTILFVQTSNLPRAQHQILFNKDSQGEICVLKKDSSKVDAIKRALAARRNNAAVFKSEKNPKDQFAIEFKFSKTPRLTLSIIISCDKESCPEDILSFVKEYTTWRLSGGQKTLIGLGTAGLIGYFLFTKNSLKSFFIKNTMTPMRRATTLPTKNMETAIKPAKKILVKREFKVSTNISLTESINSAFIFLGAKKPLLTAQDLWGSDQTAWTANHINTVAQRWLSGINQTAILIITMAEIQHPEIIKFLQENKDASHYEQRSQGSLATGRGYGSDYQNYRVFNGKKRQSIKAGDRILLINDSTEECPAEYKDKSAITWGGKMYGQIDSRSPDEIIADLESTLWSDKLIQINKFFDLEMSL